MKAKKTKKKAVKPKPEFSVSLWCWGWSDLEETDSTGALYWYEWFPTKQSASADLEAFRERLAKYDKDGQITTYGPEKHVVKSKEEMLNLMDNFTRHPNRSLPYEFDEDED